MFLHFCGVEKNSSSFSRCHLYIYIEPHILGPKRRRAAAGRRGAWGLESASLILMTGGSPTYVLRATALEFDTVFTLPYERDPGLYTTNELSENRLFIINGAVIGTVAEN